jgi:UDP-N-acetylmuramate: L-alanyl-gamma-D-glutamyl-meso-diaminopimelate ligase
LLRFAETSQQTLRHFSFVPTTYINLAEKNALKSKLLRHLTHTTIVDSRNARWEQARFNRQPKSPLSPMVHFHTLIVFWPARPFASSVKNISSPFYFTVPHKLFAFSSFHRIADKVKFLSNLISPPHFIFFSPFHSRSLLRDFAVLSEIKSVHFVGICGTAMASAAAAMQDRGFKVSGSDQNVYPPMSTFLEERGIQLMSGYREENLASKPDLVVIGNAISRGNTEAEAILEKKLRYCSLPELLKEFFIRGKKSLVVSGTHGKTTTTSLLTWVFEANRRDPSYLIGGIPNNLKQGAKFTKSDWFIIEGDEYDTAFFDKRSKFVHYLPELLIINNLEFDHADIFENLAAIQLSFKRLINIVPRNGLVLANGDDPNIAPLLEVKHCPVRRFGLGENCDVRATNLKLTESGSEFQLGSGTFRIPLIGELNVRNALAVVAAARHYGLSDKEIQNAFNSFEGIKRRLELRGVSGGISVIDDFAHHPTAIRETMRALRVRFPSQRVWAVFEPRSNTTRRNVFQNELAEALGMADGVCVAQVARLEQLQPHERLDPDRLIQSLQQAGKPAFYLPTADAIVDRLAIEARSPDVICVFSNGGFGGIHEKLLSRFQTSAN